MHSEFEIEAIHARQILDSRGNPTLECEVQLAGGAAVGDAAVPSSARVPVSMKPPSCVMETPITTSARVSSKPLTM